MAIIVSWFKAEEMFTSTHVRQKHIKGQEIGHIKRSFCLFPKWFNYQKEIYEDGKYFNLPVSQRSWYLAQIGNNTSSQLWILRYEKTPCFLLPFKHNGRSTGLPVLAKAETDHSGGTQKAKHAVFWSTVEFTGNYLYKVSLLDE